MTREIIVALDEETYKKLLFAQKSNEANSKKLVGRLGASEIVIDMITRAMEEKREKIYIYSTRNGGLDALQR